MDGHAAENAGLGQTEADMEMNGDQQMVDDQNGPNIENVDESGMNQQPEGGEDENGGQMEDEQQL